MWKIPTFAYHLTPSEAQSAASKRNEWLPISFKANNYATVLVLKKYSYLVILDVQLKSKLSESSIKVKPSPCARNMGVLQQFTVIQLQKTAATTTYRTHSLVAIRDRLPRELVRRL